jgi:dimethylhistidine N-methyltransferase
LDEVIAGLSLPQKALPPKYFYDDAGSRLFERICRLPEYYLTRAELALTKANLAAIARFAGNGCELDRVRQRREPEDAAPHPRAAPAAYLPVDISPAALRGAAERLGREFPWLEIVPVNGDFSRPVELPRSRAPRVVYFPGSTIGNLSPEEAHAFPLDDARPGRAHAGRRRLAQAATTLHAAYNDSRGVTAAFNLNLLARINRELGADFDPKRFEHYASTTPRPAGSRCTSCRSRARACASGATASSSRRASRSTRGFVQVFDRRLPRPRERAGYVAGKTWTDRRRLFALHALKAG